MTCRALKCKCAVRGNKMAATFASQYQLAVTHLGFVQNKRSFIWFGHGRACMCFWLKAELCWFSQYRRWALPLSLYPLWPYECWKHRYTPTARKDYSNDEECRLPCFGVTLSQEKDTQIIKQKSFLISIGSETYWSISQFFLILNSVRNNNRNAF